MIPLDPVTQVRGAGDGLIVLASFTNLAAIGPDGQVWVTERLCLDSLKIVDANADRIDCLGDFLDDVEAFTVAAGTGEVVEGRRFLHTWPGR